MGPLLVVAAAVALMLLLRAWFAKSGQNRLRLTIYIVVGVVVLLAATGRLHWLAAIGAALLGAIPIIAKKLFLLLRFLPLIGGFLSRAGYGKTGNGLFETAWLRLEINPAIGTMDGEVLQGEFKQRRLSSMSVNELEKLRDVLRAQDARSALLLQSYLAIRTRSRNSESEASGRPDTGSMTREEALRILGLKEDATRDDVTHAYKRLMQKIHPDRGGSAYLAAKINQAKELLAGKK